RSSHYSSTVNGFSFRKCPVHLAIWLALSLTLNSFAAPPSPGEKTKPPSPTNHWAFKPPVQSPIPKVRNQKWPRNAIDNFVLARLEQNKLSPSPEADRAALIRRLSFDLIGLPPTPQEVDDFVNDKSS